jgi:hypothetical protein
MSPACQHCIPICHCVAATSVLHYKYATLNSITLNSSSRSNAFDVYVLASLVICAKLVSPISASCPPAVPPPAMCRHKADGVPVTAALVVLVVLLLVVTRPNRRRTCVAQQCMDTFMSE